MAAVVTDACRAAYEKKSCIAGLDEGLEVNRVRASCQAVLVGVSLIGAIALGISAFSSEEN